MADENLKRLPTHGDAQEVVQGLEKIALAIHSQTASSGASASVKSWAQIQQIVRSGLAPQIFSVGQQIEVEKASAVTASSSNSALSVSVTAETFLAKMGHAENAYVEFLYNGNAWTKGGATVDPVEYGVTVTGTPSADDVVTIHETASKIVFDVLGFDQETPVDESRTHSMTLGMHYTFAGVVFDAPEAFYAFPNGLPAGSYSMTIGNMETSYGGGRTWYFTLESAIPAGGQLYIYWDSNVQIGTQKMTSYASGDSTTAIESVSISETAISGAVELGTIKNNAPHDETVTISGTSYPVKCNNGYRARYGSNRWKTSAVRQWCNSASAKGSVWKPQTEFDRPPNWVATLDGFLYGLDPELVSAIGKVKKPTKLHTFDGGGSETTAETAFLLSNYEIGSGASEDNPPYKYWLDLIGGSPVTDFGTHAEYIKTDKAGGSAKYWWLRSPYSGDATNARVVYTSGSVYSSGAYSGNQAAMALAII